MANVYVRSGAGGAGTGADWANAYTTLVAAAAAKAAGDDFWVSEDHAETAAGSKTVAFPGTAASPNRCICVDHAGTVPPVVGDMRTTATITTTGNFAITVTGNAYVYGVTLNAGTGNSGSANINLCSGTESQIWESCAFKLVTVSGSARAALCNSGYARVSLVNSTVAFGATGQGIAGSGSISITGPSGSVFITGATIPTSLFPNSSVGQTILISGADLSASTSGTKLFGNTSQPASASVRNCLLDANVTLAATPNTVGTGNIDFVGCNSTTNSARSERYRYQGTLTTETTIIRTAGASDGTTAYSWKIVTTANAKRTVYFETFEGVIWGDTTGASKTLTIHTVTDNVTLTDAEIWVEVEYLGSSATPVATLITDANATVLTAAANQTSDSGEAWTTTGLGTPVKQALSVTFTPNMKGPIRWRVKVAKATTTVYVCPKADVA